MSAVGPIGRLGRWTATHFRAVVVAWALIAVAAGILAPRVEHALSGAGWEATGSESVEARNLVDQNFSGLSSSALMVVVHSPEQRLGDPAFDRAVARARGVLRDSDAVSTLVRPPAGGYAERDGPAGVVLDGEQRGAYGRVREWGVV